MAKSKSSDPGAASVKRGSQIVLIIIIALLAWYLRADRVTPFTSQARVHALVVPIAAEVSGTITEVAVKNNQTVEMGQELFRISPERYELGLQQAEAALDQAQSGSGAANANVQAQRAALEAAFAIEKRARQDAVRMRQIRERDPGAISARRLEAAEATLKMAEGSRAAAEAAVLAAIEKAGKPGDENAAVQQALAALDNARLDLQKGIVRAPAAGVVTGVQLDEGKFAAAGHPQMTFIANDDIWIQANLKENNLEHIRPADRVGIIFDVMPGRIFYGTVREVGFGVDVQNPPLGKLPTIQNDKNWLRAEQRFPVLIDFDVDPQNEGMTHIKVGSQAAVVVYTGDYPISNFLGRVMFRIRSILAYAY